MIKKIFVVLVMLLAVATLAFAAQVIMVDGLAVTGATNMAAVLRTPNHPNISVVLYTTAISGTGATATPTIQGLDVDGNAYTLCAGQVFSASNVQQIISVGPSLVAASSAGYVQCNAPVPDLWRVSLAASANASNFLTMGINYNTAQ